MLLAILLGIHNQQRYIGVLEREGLVERAARMGELLFGLTRPLVDRYEIVRDVRGLGLMWAIELGTPSSLRRRAVWSMVERAQAGLAAQLLVVPLFLALGRRQHNVLDSAVT